jgi:hypothetical protein
VKSTVGVFLGSILGPLLHNIILDGLEVYLYKVYKNNLYYFAQYQLKNFDSSYRNSKYFADVTYIRFVDTLLILSFSNRSFMLLLRASLLKFLSLYGLFVNLDRIKVYAFVERTLSFSGFQFFPVKYYLQYKRGYSTIYGFSI